MDNEEVDRVMTALTVLFGSVSGQQAAQTEFTSVHSKHHTFSFAHI